MRGLDLSTNRDPRGRYQSAKDIVSAHYPGGNWPPGLLIDVFAALGEAELRGFSECLGIFRRQSSPDNDNGQKPG